MKAEGPFDMILADPPYGDTSLAWDEQQIEWLDVAVARLKKTGSIWIFGSMRSFFTINRPISLRYAQDVVWEKQNGSGFHADRFKRVHEHIVQFYHANAPWAEVYNDVQTTPDATARTVRRKKRPPHTGHIDAGSYESHDGGPRIMRSVIAIPNCHGHAIHPTEKPVDLLQILIRTSCPPNGLVGDFFAGSGSCAEACAVLRRNYVGCEIDPIMAAKAANRNLFVAGSAA
jgi:site-specific DNA-methyltransferase (adenine-specific)